MKAFGDYSRYYDVLYQDKDYETESCFIIDLVKKHSVNTKTILELGCGTGAHAEYFARSGYDVCGVDISDEMLSCANKRLDTLDKSLADKLTFSRADVRDVVLDKKFDVVLSLFHVMSYQTSNEDVLKTLLSARKHLKLDGIFIFDVWYGPAVLSDPPVVRVKRLENDHIEVVRIAEPVMHAIENIVDVNYQVFITDKVTQEITVLNETHRMRYFFNTEFELLFDQVGMKCTECHQWLTHESPDYRSWNVHYVVRNIVGVD